MTSSSILGESRYLVETSLVKRARRASVILMATDGGERSDGALRAAADRADGTGATLELVSIIKHEPLFDAVAAVRREADGNPRQRARRALVEQQVTRVLGSKRVVSITVAEGNTAFTISRFALDRRACMVVVGLGRHLLADRVFSDETALQLARMARVPVLAVPEGATTAVRHAVVAVDFSDISARAAQTAIESVADDGRVDLVHVVSPALDEALPSDFMESARRRSVAKLGELAGQLAVPARIQLNCVVLTGQPVSELLSYASRVDADMIATGTHGRGFVTRTLIGSVTTNLLRGATCAVLTMPREPLPKRAPTAEERLAGMTFESPMAWTGLLNDFSARNAGRRAILEADDLEIGAHMQDFNYPLLGASYSERDGQFDVMLGERSPVGCHLTRAISNVTAVEVITDGTGHDVGLRVQHGESHTLLTFAT